MNGLRHLLALALAQQALGLQRLARLPQAQGQFVQPLLLVLQALLQQALDAFCPSLQLQQAIGAGRGHQLSGGRGGGRAHIGTKIGNGEIGLVPHATDQWHRALHNGVGQGLIVKSPQIFHRAATAHQQDGIHRGVRARLLRQRVHLVQSRHQRGRRLLPLHQGGHQHHRQIRGPALQGGHHIVQSSRPQRGHQTNPPGHGGQGALALRSKQALRLQTLFQAQELLHPAALPGPLQFFDNQLQIATLLVHPQLALQLDQIAIAR